MKTTSIKKFTGKQSLLFLASLALVICFAALLSVKAKAQGNEREWPKEPKTSFYFYNSEVLDEHDFRFGTESEADLTPDTAFYFVWDNLTGKKKHHSITVSSEEEIEQLAFVIYHEFDIPDFYDLYTIEDFTKKYDKETGKYTYTINVTSDYQSFCFSLYNYSATDNKKYTLQINEESEIQLAKTAITEITNTRHLTMTVKYQPVKKRLGYQIEYATNSKFNNKTRVNTGATSKDVGKLTKGNIYYVRVRSYARYSDGALVYSKWSPTKKIKIKK